MEPLNKGDSPSLTLVPRIKALLQLASDFIDVFDDMIQEATSSRASPATASGSQRFKVSAHSSA